MKPGKVGESQSLSREVYIAILVPEPESVDPGSDTLCCGLSFCSVSLSLEAPEGAGLCKVVWVEGQVTHVAKGQ